MLAAHSLVQRQVCSGADGLTCLLAQQQVGGGSDDGACLLARQRVGGGADYGALTSSAIPCSLGHDNESVAGQMTMLARRCNDESVAGRMTVPWLCRRSLTCWLSRQRCRHWGGGQCLLVGATHIGVEADNGALASLAVPCLLVRQRRWQGG